MFSQTWKKYLPVITILLKRASTGPQTLSMNSTDFERAAAGRKIKYSFAHLIMTKGRINIEVKHSPLARELATMLQEDDMAKKLLSDQLFEFSMTNDFVLTIKNNTAADEEESESNESNVEAEAVTAE
jgi:hypothetical protein